MQGSETVLFLDLLCKVDCNIFLSLQIKCQVDVGALCLGCTIGVCNWAMGTDVGLLGSVSMSIGVGPDEAVGYG